MTNQEKYEYWLEYAEYDLQTAAAMLASGRWLYVVFMCQQALEKLVKGLYLLYVDDNVPKLHNIGNLLSKFADRIPEPVTDEKYQLFERLSSYYLNARYPAYRDKLSKITDENSAKLLFEQSKEAFKWLLTLKP
ncbi:hypothetical protein AGMMS49959_13490 [Planctomycetales bacterium]|nr:hypothetical protein AGMMS49959_13490 [Planctomycetales bacterium]